MDVLIKEGYLLEPGKEFESSDIWIKDGKIYKIGNNLEPDIEFETIHAKDKIVTPGQISSHSHIMSIMDRGLVDNQHLELWRVALIFGGVKPTMRDIYVATTLGAAELLSNGCTSVFEQPTIKHSEMVEGATTVAEACIESGIRATIAPWYSDLKYSQTMPLNLLEQTHDIKALDQSNVLSKDELLASARTFIDEWKGKSSLIKCALGPSGPDRCSEELLLGTSELAKKLDVPVQMHLCETKSQAIKGYERFGKSTVKYLNEIGFLNSRTSLAHAIWIDDKDIEILAKNKVTVVHNPLSNLKLGSGIAPIPTMMRRGLDIAIGADDGSSGSLDVYENIKLAALVHKISGPRSQWVSAKDAFDFTLKGGAKVMESNIGKIEEGALADLTIMNGQPYFNIADSGYMISQLIYNQPSRTVETVIVDGKVVVDNGRVLNVDVTELRKEAQDYIKRIEMDMPNRIKKQSNVEQVLDELHEKLLSDTSLSIKRLI